MNKKERMIIIILVILLILIDQILKIYNIINNNISNVPISKDNISYILINIIAITVIARYISNKNSFIKIDSRVVLSFALAGALSNIIDRIFMGKVINYISIPKFTEINLAYIYIFITWIGMAAILTRYTINKIKEKRKI